MRALWALPRLADHAPSSPSPDHARHALAPSRAITSTPSKPAQAPAIRALYRASQAGVRVQLNVRGICALRPGVPGVSENIEVVSIVGRFLEHSRIYSFERPAETNIYMGSADLMPRNLYQRVELVVPVEDERARAELLEILDISLADNTNAWTLGEDGAWTRRTPNGSRPRSAQWELIDLHAGRAAEPASR